MTLCIFCYCFMAFFASSCLTCMQASGILFLYLYIAFNEPLSHHTIHSISTYVAYWSWPWLRVYSFCLYETFVFRSSKECASSIRTTWKVKLQTRLCLIEKWRRPRRHMSKRATKKKSRRAEQKTNERLKLWDFFSVMPFKFKVVLL